jgi:hypothetical protein
MKRIHINWTACQNWDKARGKLYKLKAPVVLYGNFADYYRESGDDAESELKNLGFGIHRRIDNYEPRVDTYIVLKD